MEAGGCGRLAEIVARGSPMTDHNLQTLGKLTPGYAQIQGIGEARATLISAAMELGRRRTAYSQECKNKDYFFKDVYNRYVDRLSDLYHEEFHVLLLKRSNDVLAELKISSGGLSGTVADPKLIFAKALALVPQQ